jgi:hypothetical protein
MATTKVVTVLDDNVTLAHDSANHTSGLLDLQDGYGGLLQVKITNGVTGPTIAAQCQVQVSGDNSNWYNLGGALISTLGNSIVTSWSVPIPIGAKYLHVVSGSNTGQDVTLRVTGVEVSEIS